MTRTEFYLRAMLALASNPKYVFLNKDEEQKDAILMTNAVAMDAARLADAAEEEWDRPFDIDLEEAESTPKSILREISDILVGINCNIAELVNSK